MQICKWTSLSSRLFDKSEDFCNMIPLSCKSNWTPRLLQQKVVHLKHLSFFLTTGVRAYNGKTKNDHLQSFNQNQSSKSFECDVIMDTSTSATKSCTFKTFKFLLTNWGTSVRRYDKKRPFKPLLTNHRAANRSNVMLSLVERNVDSRNFVRTDVRSYDGTAEETY